MALFLSAGQHDMTEVISPEGAAKGNSLKGKDIYQGVCISCHGETGREPIYGEPGGQSSLGWLSRNRPEEVVHKIRNGVPNADMLSLRFLDLSKIGDLLADLQTLDAE